MTKRDSNGHFAQTKNRGKINTLPVNHKFSVSFCVPFLHRWSLIAGRLPGRTDNEVKNFWNTHLNKRSRRGKRMKITPKDDDSISASIPTQSMENTNLVEGSIKQEDEMDSIMNSWMEHMGIENCNINSSISTNNLPWIFEDVPLIPILDDVLLDAFQRTGDETLLDGIHPFLL